MKADVGQEEEMKLKPFSESYFTPRAFFLLAAIPLIVLTALQFVDVVPYDNLNRDTLITNILLLGLAIIFIALGIASKRSRNSKRTKAEI